ncbi:MAG: GIY-YIG nuclease family protein [Patescibacteria group bacterium]
MFAVYILYSEILGKHYVGHTEDLNVRLTQHNVGHVRSTKAGIPWAVVHVEEYPTRQRAYRRELQIKAYKRGEAFKKLVKK